MTEKRFTSEVTDTGVYYYDNGVRIFPEDFLTIMNRLHEENQKLKKEMDNFYLLIGKGDWIGVVDLLKGLKGDLG